MSDKPQLLICKTCDHFWPIYQGSFMPKIPACGVEGRRDPVDGELVYRRCELMRASYGQCGPDGLLHSSRGKAAEAPDA